jgi:hypothetical protein
MKLLFLVLLLASCTKHSQIKEVDGKTFLVFEDVGVVNTEEVEWRVGPLSRDSISKGIKFQIELPQFEPKQFESTMVKNGVDSWIIQVRKVTHETIKVIATGVVPLYASTGLAGLGSNDKVFRQSERVSVNIYYEIAAFSARYADMMCPANNHRLKIKKFSESVMQERAFTEIKQQGHSYSKIPTNMLNTAIVGNGGKTLVGHYVVELALFNSVIRRRMSEFVPLAKRVHVQREEEKYIPACDNFKVPASDSIQDRYKQFKFSR